MTREEDGSTPAARIALWADQLRDLSAMGLRFSRSIYDTANYRKVQDIAMAMFALATGVTEEQMEPLRGPFFSRPTLVTTGDVAVIDDEGRILLIRRPDNGMWAMPGGALEVGETPAEGVMREALEETGVACRAAALVGVFDSRFCGTPTRRHLYQFVFLCRPSEHQGEMGPSHPDEVLEVRWFPEDALPGDMDPGHASRIPEAFRVWHGETRPFFDRP